jgi:hypothetical protein
VDGACPGRRGRSRGGGHEGRGFVVGVRQSRQGGGGGWGSSVDAMPNTAVAPVMR